MQTVELKTVYRTEDAEHLVFLNSIRLVQPHRPELEEYWAGRHWKKSRALQVCKYRQYLLQFKESEVQIGNSMTVLKQGLKIRQVIVFNGTNFWEYIQECVADGLAKAQTAGELFVWLTCTNRGASEVCEAAVELVGITKPMLETGFFCDPTSKSFLRIVAKPGVYIRLTRNFDKKRGFVNGATGTVVESLQGNAVFTVRLFGTGNLVLVHPMYEQGATFLPCCYGYATTIRRAQGADLFHGCIYMDQLKRVASRGYAYVACSRFKSKAGCYLYGNLRVSDFLPVGLPREDEHIARSIDSESSDEECAGNPNISRRFDCRPGDSDDELPLKNPDFAMHDFE